jgi:hypothetical protein
MKFGVEGVEQGLGRFPAGRGAEEMHRAPFLPLAVGFLPGGVGGILPQGVFSPAAVTALRSPCNEVSVTACAAFRYGMEVRGGGLVLKQGVRLGLIRHVAPFRRGRRDPAAHGSDFSFRSIGLSDYEIRCTRYIS